MSQIDWPSVATEFASDGSLRDIYVHDTTVSDWQAVYEHVRSHYDPVRFTIDGEGAQLPSAVGDLFTLREKASLEANFFIGSVHLATHFFTPEEIEFDFWPEDVHDSQQFALLIGFLGELAALTGKAAVVTPEALPTDPILRFDPRVGDVEFLASPDARAG